MRAAVCRAVDQIEIEELDTPRPREGEVRLRMVATGVCGTDLSVFRGHLPVPYPIVLGHEGAGIVEEVGPGVRDLAPGDSVVCTIIAGCRHCAPCAAGTPTLCECIQFYTGKMFDGTTRLSRDGTPIHSLSYQAAFAEQAIVPEVCAIKVRGDAPLERVAGLACGISTGLGAAMVRAPAEPGSAVVVIGMGGVGLSALMGARLRGAAIRVGVDVMPAKLARARELGLATHTVDASADGVDEALRAILGARGGADFAYDAAGAKGTLATAVRTLRPGGTAVAIGLSGPNVKLEIEASWILRERWVTGTFGGSIVPRRHIPEFVDLYMGGQLDLDPLMDAAYPLERIRDALEDLEAGRVTRPVLRF